MSIERAPKVTDRKMTFREELALQRWDDHRYYHHSRINQSLHLFSAACFMTAYVMLFYSATAAALLGWIFAMCSRQIGHFFFEPKSYDEVNHATHEYKEDIKVGYNLFRKRVLQSIWAITPFVLLLNPTLFGIFEAPANWDAFVYNLSVVWIVLGVAALVFRTIQLFFLRNMQTGLVWATKILTDPFHDFKIYLKSPLYLARGELIDPMLYVNEDSHEDESEEHRDALAH